MLSLRLFTIWLVRALVKLKGTCRVGQVSDGPVAMLLASEAARAQTKACACREATVPLATAARHSVNSSLHRPVAITETFPIPG